jgi:ubiquinone/menaquinone biosynthesis C-methylase UbiE
MSRLVFDEALAEQMEVVYRSRDVLRRRRLVYEALGARPGERVLDVGCGPGFYASELLDQVGAEGSVVALDASPQMLAVAAHRCEGRPNVSFHQADATSLPVDDGGFDGAISVQVLEYVADVEAALGELHRALRPGGRVVLWDVDWATLSWHSRDPARMERALRAWDEHLVDPSLPRTLASRVRAAGFEDVAMEGHAFATAEFTPDAYGGSLLPLIAGYLATVDGFGPEEAAAWFAEQRELAERGEFYFACMQLCFTGTRAG